MKNWSIASVGFLSLLLLGAGCASADVDGDDVDMVEVEDVAVVARMVDFHNNYIPSYDLKFDDNMYTVAFGDTATEKEAENSFLIVNSNDVWWFAEGGDSSEKLLSMVYTKVESPTNESVEATLGAIASSKDMLFGDIDARQHEMKDGTTVYVIVATNGYYQMTVLDQALASTAKTLSF